MRRRDRRRSKCQRVELVRCGRSLVLDVAELVFADHIHGFDTDNYDSCTPIGFESEHAPRDSFDGAIVLLDNIAQIFKLAPCDSNAAIGLGTDDARFVRAALVNGDFLRHVVQADGTFEKCAGHSVAVMVF